MFDVLRRLNRDVLGSAFIALLAIVAAASPMRDAGAQVAAASDGGFAVATPESQGLSSQALADLAAVVRGFVDKESLVGGELVVIQNRHVVLHEAFGMSDREAGRAWQTNTICNIRSMTKTFTGAAAQMLIDRGLLSLNDRVSKYLRGFDNDASRDITIEQLMTHRSGLPLSIMATREDMKKFASLAEQTNAVGARGPEFAPGSKFWYSDAGSDTLATVVEKITGKTIDEFWRTELFEPLGMRDTFVPLDAKDPRFAGIAPLYAGQAGTWQRLWSPADGLFYPYAWGSQTAYSTAIDYAKFLAMWMDGGKVGDRAVLSPEAVARTLTPMTPMSMLGADARFPTDFAGLEVWYGRMAVLHVPQDNPATSKPQIIGHSGSDGTIAWAWPERDLMILLFTQTRGSPAALRIEEAIERLLLHPETGAAVAAEIPEKFKPMVGTYIANFAAFRNEEFQVLVKNGKLALDIPSQMVFELLEPAAADTSGQWKFALAPEAISVSFDQQQDGRFNVLKIHQAGMTFEAPRKGSKQAEAAARLMRVDPEKVKPLLGAYFHPEANANVTVLIEDGVLCLKAPQGAMFHFTPGEDGKTWTLQEVPGVTLTFEFNDKGEVVSMTRHKGGETMVMPRQADAPSSPK